MAYTTIDNPTSFFNTNLWTGNGSSQSISGLNFAPDWVWIKQRSGTRYHNLQDTIRGTGVQLFSNTNGADNTDSTNITAFNSDGYSLGAGQNVNNSSSTYVGWSWLAGGSTSSNGNGSITSTVSANTTAGFSIVSYAGTGSAATVGHGLGVAPRLIIIKNRSSTESWRVYHGGLGATKEIYLDLTSAAGTSSSSFNNTDPTSSVFSVGTGNGTNKSGDNLIAYCFAEKKGYSKFGVYTGQGGAGGQYPFIYTGFRPAFVITKRADTGGDNWHILDNTRDIDNPAEQVLQTNDSGAEATTSTSKIDFLSNGFKLRGTGASINTNGLTYIYIAFAEHPFVTEGTKAAGTAR